MRYIYLSFLHLIILSVSVCYAQDRKSYPASEWSAIESLKRDKDYFRRMIYEQYNKQNSVKMATQAKELAIQEQKESNDRLRTKENQNSVFRLKAGLMPGYYAGQLANRTLSNYAEYWSFSMAGTASIGYRIGSGNPRGDFITLFGTYGWNTDGVNSKFIRDQKPFTTPKATEFLSPFYEIEFGVNWSFVRASIGGGSQQVSTMVRGAKQALDFSYFTATLGVDMFRTDVLDFSVNATFLSGTAYPSTAMRLNFIVCVWL